MSTILIFNDPSPTTIYTLSLHDALPIFTALGEGDHGAEQESVALAIEHGVVENLGGLEGRVLIEQHGAENRLLRFVAPDRKSTRLNSSHTVISYAVFCLKKKKNTHERHQ